MKTPEDAADNKVGRKTPDEIKADAAKTEEAAPKKRLGRK